MKGKPITAGELLRQLENDPKFVAEEKLREEIFARKREKNALAEAPLVAELRSAGVPISSVWDLVNAKFSYSGVLPILLDHLGRSYPDDIRDGIARAMSDQAAKFAWRELVDMYLREPRGSRTDQGLAVALSIIANQEEMPELIALIRNSELGSSRGLLIDALKRSNESSTDVFLNELLLDPILSGEAKRVLKLRRRRKPK
ncbi:hypothetical protein SSBR45G_73480 [Bradyrhizobium sp. SSBR45G]|uniref:hypothetical protein n=1 Tax=unclassified Bradyrhizobium TaxID=2631580 RepID=UPI002342BAB5|nr:MULTISPECIES: hypothetical protein [unclassified Bradyrhizobium]GLH82439.1 hypothetical protein SSBR45G_73480 [Bradyrhizobium sp. SSBR45G]GLH89872.1 hypothetical protein SSBR45R_73330 [Bradyrhizobium sp. SSBR45R]